MKKLILASLAAAVAALATPIVHAQLTGSNLVTNPGFEDGSFTGYTVTDATTGSNLTINSFLNNPHSGQYAAAFGATADEYDTISQSLATIPMTLYDVSFYLKYNASQADASFVAQFGGTTLLSVSGTYGDGIYAEYSYRELATGTSTQLLFKGYDQGAYYFLDDIAVNQVVPEPSTWAMMGVGAASLLTLVRRRAQAV